VASRSSIREELYETFADPSDATDEQIRRALELGTRYLGLGLGFRTRIGNGTQEIAEEIAAAHGWTVSISESSDGGARFSIRTRPEGGG
jgi:hypothetical protein